MAIDRRKFLQTSLATLPLALPGRVLGWPMSPLFTAMASDPSDRVLVLINLVGGNDGLNTLVPLDQYDNLARVRSNVLIPRNKLVGLNDKLAFHPSLTPLAQVWDGGRLGMVQSVGYPDQNGSHFRSSDIWSSASASNVVTTTGWLGRNFDRAYPGFPENYPNPQNTDPIAISMGSASSETCQGLVSNFSLAVYDPRYSVSVQELPGTTIPNTSYGSELAFLRTSAEQTNAYGEVVSRKVQGGRNLVNYPENNDLAQQLKFIAQMISGGLQTKVYVATIDGFDTHAGQVEEGDTIKGDHATLLANLGGAVAAFQADVKALGLGERVLTMTFSEFGRRIRSNEALGTDHGAAAPLFLFGDCVRPGVLGNNPIVDPNVGDSEDVPMQYDFRDVYGSVLQDWFGVEPARIREVIAHDYIRLPILRDCSVVDVEGADGEKLALQAEPTFFRAQTQLTFSLPRAGEVQLEAYDGIGRRLETLFLRKLPAGDQRVMVNTSDYPTGAVMFRLRQGAAVQVIRTVKG